MLFHLDMLCSKIQEGAEVYINCIAHLPSALAHCGLHLSASRTIMKTCHHTTVLQGLWRASAALRAHTRPAPWHPLPCPRQPHRWLPGLPALSSMPHRLKSAQRSCIGGPVDSRNKFESKCALYVEWQAKLSQPAKQPKSSPDEGFLLLQHRLQPTLTISEDLDLRPHGNQAASQELPSSFWLRKGT